MARWGWVCPAIGLAPVQGLPCTQAPRISLARCLHSFAVRKGNQSLKGVYCFYFLTVLDTFPDYIYGILEHLHDLYFTSQTTTTFRGIFSSGDSISSHKSTFPPPTRFLHQQVENSRSATQLPIFLFVTNPQPSFRATCLRQIDAIHTTVAQQL